MLVSDVCLVWGHSWRVDLFAEAESLDIIHSLSD